MVATYEKEAQETRNVDGVKEQLRQNIESKDFKSTEHNLQTLQQLISAPGFEFEEGDVAGLSAELIKYLQQIPLDETAVSTEFTRLFDVIESKRKGGN